MDLYKVCWKSLHSDQFKSNFYYGNTFKKNEKVYRDGEKAWSIFKLFIDFNKNITYFVIRKNHILKIGLGREEKSRFWIILEGLSELIFRTTVSLYGLVFAASICIHYKKLNCIFSHK